MDIKGHYRFYKKLNRKIWVSPFKRKKGIWNWPEISRKSAGRRLTAYNKSEKGRATSRINGKNHDISGSKRYMLNGGSKRSNLFNNTPEQREKHRKRTREKMLNGQAVYMLSFVKNPSKPQVEIFKSTKEVYKDSVLNYPCLNYSLDIAIPSLRINIEYDGSYYHQNEEYDRKRQSKIEQQGWKVLRYKDFIPSKDQLIKDINRVVND